MERETDAWFEKRVLDYKGKTKVTAKEKTSLVEKNQSNY
jgi:hypothetical protein